MGKQKRKKLEQERDKLNQKLSHANQLRDKKFFLLALDNQNINYTIYYDEDATARKVLEQFPITSYGVLDLSKINDSIELAFENESDLSAKISQIIKENKIKDSEVYIIWAYGPVISIKTSLQGVVENIAILFNFSDDLFIVCPKNSWAIMFHHDNKVLFGRK